jgi:hypothetical protein
MGNPEKERLLLDRALEALAKETGLTARVVGLEPCLTDGRRPDALVEVVDQLHTYLFEAEVKNTIDRFETLHQLQAFWPHGTGEQLIVIAPYITQQLAERCREMELCFADTAGNAYVRAPGLHVYVTGKKKPQELEVLDENRPVNAAGLRVIFALLCRPNLLNATYREIAANARVALGTVGQAIRYLETRRYITPQQILGATTHRQFLNPQRLLEEWVALYPTLLRPKLNPRRFRAARPNWREGMDLTPYGAFWGGEVAANRLAHYLQPHTATIYARENPTKLLVDQRMKADVNGDTEFLDVFWNAERMNENKEQLPAMRDVVPPILIYADLMTTTDGRNIEAAKMIYDEYIGPLLGN